MNIKNILIFAFGAGLGSAVTWKLVKDYYEKITREEIETVREVYASSKKEPYTEEELRETVENILKDEVEQEQVEEYKDIVNNEGYNNEPEIEEDDYYLREEVTTMDGKPYVIDPAVFGDSDYRMVEITYFADKVMMDDDGDILTDKEIEEKIGHYNLNTFGKFEDDRIFVRNDEYKTDYEILLDNRIYTKEYRDELEDEFESYDE